MTTSTERVVRNALSREINYLNHAIENYQERLAYVAKYPNSEPVAKQLRNRISTLKKRRAKAENAVINFKQLVKWGIL